MVYRRVIVWILCCSLLAAGVYSLFYRPDEEVNAPSAMPMILVDPGHGGIDGGAVATDGTREKDINLAIARLLRDMLIVWGYPVSMTRQTDVSIHDASATTVREIKVSDMHNRLAMYQQASLVIAIHQNHFSQTQYHGTQVFFAYEFPEAKQLASSVQMCVKAALQPDNTREIKAASDGIFLLYRTTRPAILVECGFLSNPTERNRLKTSSYQQQLACAIFGGYWNHLDAM